MNPVVLPVVTRLPEERTPSGPSPQPSFPSPIQSEASTPWFRFDTHPGRHGPHARDSPPPRPIHRAMRRPCATMPPAHPVPCRARSFTAPGTLPQRSPRHRRPHRAGHPHAQRPTGRALAGSAPSPPNPKPPGPAPARIDEAQACPQQGAAASDRASRCFQPLLDGRGSPSATSRAPTLLLVCIAGRASVVPLHS